MGIFAIFMLVKGFKKFCGKGGQLERRKETKLKGDAEKFEKLKKMDSTVVIGWVLREAWGKTGEELPDS